MTDLSEPTEPELVAAIGRLTRTSLIRRGHVALLHRLEDPSVEVWVDVDEQTDEYVITLDGIEANRIPAEAVAVAVAILRGGYVVVRDEAEYQGGTA